MIYALRMILYNYNRCPISMLRIFITLEFLFIASYWELHKWTIDNHTKFWEGIWNFFGVIASKPYDEVRFNIF